MFTLSFHLLLPVLSTYHRPRAELLHWQGQKLSGDGFQDHLWENLPELVGQDTSQTPPYARKLPTRVRRQSQTSIYISLYLEYLGIHLQYLAIYLAVCVPVCWSVYCLPTVPNYICLSVAWKTTTTAVIQTMTRGHGATPLTARNYGSTARSPNVMLVPRRVGLTTSIQDNDCIDHFQDISAEDE